MKKAVWREIRQTASVFLIALKGRFRVVSRYYNKQGLTSERHEESWINRDAVSGVIFTSSFFVCSFAVRATRV